MGKDDRWQKNKEQAAKNGQHPNGQSASPASPAQSASQSPPAKDAKPLSETEKLRSQLVEYEDHLKRLAAEFDNYKKRAEKEKQAARMAGKAEALAPFLDMDEVFEKALEHSKSNPKEAGNSSAIHDGLVLLHKQLHSIFAHAGVLEINCHGAPNHAYHETIMQVAGEPDGEIAQVLRKGYTMGEYVLRPAQVSVNKSEEKAEENANIEIPQAEEEKTNEDEKKE